LIGYYGADVTTAQDYYPFGMLQPGRSGYSISGGWATSGTGQTSTPSLLQISSRSSNGPALYQATELIEFVAEFQSGSGDEFIAEIGSGSSSGGSGGSGSGIVGNSYRYGFNGKENDNEVKGEGGQQDYGMRIYDPRIGKFLSVDPITRAYPELTPYQFASNRPIDGIDLDGKEWSKSESLDKDGNRNIAYNIKIKVVDKDFCADQVKLNQIAMSVGGQLAVAFNKASSLGVEYEFKVELTKVDQLVTGDYGVEINNSKADKEQVYGMAMPGSTTQKGNILLATSTLSKYLMTAKGGVKKEVVKENALPIDFIAHKLAHELLHTSKLDHPWKEKLIKDIAQNGKDGSRSAVPDETIKRNFMNSPENPVPELQPNDKTRENKELTPGQVDYVKKVVELQSKSNKSQ
jgi:RHS repeat-associated protein